MAPLSASLLPPGAAEDLLVDLVGQLGVGYGELALEIVGPELLELLVRLGVYPGDEEARHGVHARGISPVLDEPLEAPGVGAGHLAVALEGEDQGDVYGLAAGDHLLYSNEPRQRGRYLDEEVGPVDHLVQPRGLLDRGLRVVGDVRLDLQGDEAVLAPGLLVDRHEDVAGVPGYPSWRSPRRSASGRPLFRASSWSCSS